MTDVQVTLLHIGQGSNSHWGNPVALALQEQFKDPNVLLEYRGDPPRLYITLLSDRKLFIPLPDEAEQWLLQFFEDPIKVRPFQFTIDYTHRSARDTFLFNMRMKKIARERKYLLTSSNTLLE